MKKFETLYSGDASREFWKYVNKYGDKDAMLYGLGCKLQNLEGVVLEILNERIKEKKVRKR
jgi:hypothetical protein